MTVFYDHPPDFTCKSYVLYFVCPFNPSRPDRSAPAIGLSWPLCKTCTLPTVCLVRLRSKADWYNLKTGDFLPHRWLEILPLTFFLIKLSILFYIIFIYDLSFYWSFLFKEISISLEFCLSVKSFLSLNFKCNFTILY